MLTAVALFGDHIQSVQGYLRKKQSQARWKKVLVVGPQLPAQATSDHGKNYKFFHVVMHLIT